MSEPCSTLEGWPAVDRWRRGERDRLLSARLDMDRETRESVRAAVTRVLDDLLSPRHDQVIGFYWPWRGEIDLRPLMDSMMARGARVALPAVVARGQPIEYRRWHPGGVLERNALGIPVPAVRDVVVPEVLLSPLLGFDDNNYRLGIGGGYFDRTLASLDRLPWTIGVGADTCRLTTIHPQPHDVPMDLIVTEARVQVRPRATARRPAVTGVT